MLAVCFHTLCFSNDAIRRSRWTTKSVARNSRHSGASPVTTIGLPSQPDSVTALLRFFMDLASLIVSPVNIVEEERRCEELAAAAAPSPLRISCRSAASWGVPSRSVRVRFSGTPVLRYSVYRGSGGFYGERGSQPSSLNPCFHFVVTCV